MSLNVNNKRPDALRLAAEFFCDNDPAFAFRILQKCDVTEEQIGKIQEMIKAAGLASAPEENRMRIANIRDRIVAALDTHLCFPSPFTSASGCFYSDKPFEFGGKWYTTLFHCVYTQMYRDQPKLVNLIAQCDTLDEVLEFVKLNPMTEKRKILWENSQDKNKSEEAVWMHACRAQFGQIPELKAALEATGNLFLVCDGPELDLSNGWTAEKGENALGRRLMKLRKEYGGVGEEETSSRTYEKMIQKRNKQSQLFLSSFNADIWGNILTQCDNTTAVASLFLLNKQSHKGAVNTTTAFMPIDTLMKICSPNLQIVFTGLRVIPEKFDKLKVIKICHLLNPLAKLERPPCMTLLVKELNLGMNEISAIAKQGGIKMSFNLPQEYSTEVVFECLNSETNQRSLVLMTNFLIPETRNTEPLFQNLILENLTYLTPKRTVKDPGLECRLPKIFDLITLFVFTKLNYDRFPWEKPSAGCSSLFLDPPYRGRRVVAINASRNAGALDDVINIGLSLLEPNNNLGSSGMWEL